MTEFIIIPTPNIIVADAGGEAITKIQVIQHHLELYLFNSFDTLSAAQGVMVEQLSEFKLN